MEIEPTLHTTFIFLTLFMTTAQHKNEEYHLPLLNHLSSISNFIIVLLFLSLAWTMLLIKLPTLLDFMSLPFASAKC